MADWQFKLDLKDVWRKSDEDEVNTVELSKVMVERMKALVVEIRVRSKVKSMALEKGLAQNLLDMADDLEDNVIPMFEEIVEIGDDDVESFDNALSYLYDWADAPLDNKVIGGKKMCWVSTVL